MIRTQGLAKSLVTLTSVQKLQRALYAKAKTESSYRFYSLWDKIVRMDILKEAYKRCRQNGGSAGVDQETFVQIDDRGLERWLENLQEELKDGRYHPQPLKRVWIPKTGTKELRPLSVPCIRDRVLQVATALVIEPIFEADFDSYQYGFRPKLDA